MQDKNRRHGADIDQNAARRIRACYERTARSYDATIQPFERWFLKDCRSWAAARARGDILEIGIGTGRNLQHYPPGVDLVGVDVSPAMLAIAQQRASELGLSVDLRPGDAESLAFGDATFDTVVCTLVLCSVPDERRALAEIARVLRPGGLLVLVEHVRSQLRAVRFIERILDPLVVRLQEDHLLRDPMDHLASAGFEVETCERMSWGVIERVAARKPPRAHLA